MTISFSYVYLKGLHLGNAPSVPCEKIKLNVSIVICKHTTNKNLRNMGTHQCLSAIFIKGNSFYGFLLASLEHNTLLRRVYLKEKNLLLMSKFFPLRADPIKKGSKNELAELVPLEVYLHLEFNMLQVKIKRQILLLFLFYFSTNRL